MDIELFPYPNQQIQPSSSNTGFPHARNSDSRNSGAESSLTEKPSTNKDLKKKDLSKKYLSLSIETIRPVVDKIIGERDFEIDVQADITAGNLRIIKGTLTGLTRNSILSPYLKVLEQQNPNLNLV